MYTIKLGQSQDLDIPLYSGSTLQKTLHNCDWSTMVIVIDRLFKYCNLIEISSVYSVLTHVLCQLEVVITFAKEVTFLQGWTKKL